MSERRSRPASVAPPTLRIFVSSPGDVARERALAERVIEGLQTEFAGRARLEAFLWEHEPLLATKGFQEQILRPSECDIAVFILWSRLGTRLPKNVTRPDGSRYASGTEFGNAAVHISDFLDGASITNQRQGINEGDLQGFDHPNLNGGAPTSFIGGNGNQPADPGPGRGSSRIASADSVLHRCPRREQRVVLVCAQQIGAFLSKHSDHL